ncbi:hypothetical protein LXA43DRAFT_1096569 [Ganoderma leucocontextum]|nr:hypothetical protein LXA43DRAFT_1096569 [Ganoderma leucocontextum]
MIVAVALAQLRTIGASPHFSSSSIPPQAKCRFVGALLSWHLSFASHMVSPFGYHTSHISSYTAPAEVIYALCTHHRRTSPLIPSISVVLRTSSPIVPNNSLVDQAPLGTRLDQLIISAAAYYATIGTHQGDGPKYHHRLYFTLKDPLPNRVPHGQPFLSIHVHVVVDNQITYGDGSRRATIVIHFRNTPGPQILEGPPVTQAANGIPDLEVSSDFTVGALVDVVTASDSPLRRFAFRYHKDLGTGGCVGWCRRAMEVLAQRGYCPPEHHSRMKTAYDSWVPGGGPPIGFVSPRRKKGGIENYPSNPELGIWFAPGERVVATWS